MALPQYNWPGGLLKTGIIVETSNGSEAASNLYTVKLKSDRKVSIFNFM